MLKEISIANFKSIKNATFRLKPLSFVCGPNASGKTNLAESLDFLSHILRQGLQFAVAEKGGFYNICFRRFRRSKGAIAFRIIGERSVGDERIGTYEIAFSIKALSESIRAQFVVVDEEYIFAIRNKRTEANVATLRVTRGDERYTVEQSQPPETEFAKWFGFQEARPIQELFARLFRPEQQQLLISSQGFTLGVLRTMHNIVRDLDGLRVFQISPRVARQPGVPSVEKGLGRHGENLPVAIDTFLSRRKDAGRLKSWMRDVVPSFEDWQTSYTETRQVGLSVKESGFGSPWSTVDLSDGTISSLALFICLLEPTHRVILIEEPENSLHPWALKRFLERCREVSNEKQIIITTHSPMVVAAARPEELFLIERPLGETQIIPAIEREPTISEIIRKDILDLGDYWMSGGIGAVPEPHDSPEEDESKNS